MAINFNNPWGLLLIPLGLALIYYIAKGLKGFSKKKRRTILAIRSIIVVLLVMSLAGLSIKSTVDTISTIFAVDLSESTRYSHDEFRGFIESALEHKGTKDKIGVVTFGESGEVEMPLSESMGNIEFQTTPDERFTNIEKGLKLASALIPDNTMKRIVLLTDGEENLGNSLEEGSLLDFNNIDFKVLEKLPSQTSEVQINSIDVPQNLYENQNFEVVVEIYSNIKTKSKVTLYSGRSVVGEEDVNIQKGNNRFVFSDISKDSGFKSYKAVISPEVDSVVENNTFATYTEVIGKPNILLVDGEDNGAVEISKILNSSEINTNYIKSNELPSNIAELSKYKSIVLCDVSLENVNDGFINGIKSYVRDYGGGLVVTGGENSYALGGYYKTPLEEVLPVNMEMKVKGEVPSLGLILVIDKSGSMGGEGYESKIEIAKEAAIKAVDSIKLKDKIGVIAFDGAAQWVVEPSGIDEKDNIKDQIGTIRAGGGTSIIPALDEAYLALKDLEVKSKHVILLTDGQAERSGYDQLIKNMGDEGITISTVAVGSGADQYLLESIATEGKGRYYMVDEYSTIPQIFTKETFLASKTYINNRTFAPSVTYFHDIINPFISGIPLLDGYISTSEKDRAENILLSDRDEPILSAWQYGLGRSVAWTSDVNGKWTSSYLQSEEGIEFFKNIVEWTLPRVSSENLLFESVPRGNEMEITVKNIDKVDKAYNTKLTIIGPDNTKKEVDLSIKRPGEYSSIIPIEEKGVYILKANQYKDNEIVNTANHGLAVNYSAEYDITNSSNRLKTLVNRANGQFITDPKEVFTEDFNRVYGMKDLSRLLIILALCLFIIDIALRRLNIRFKRLEKAYDIAQNQVGKTITNINKSNKQKKKITKEVDDIKEHVSNNKDTILESKKDDNAKKENKQNKDDKSGKLDTSRLLKAKDKRKK